MSSKLLEVREFDSITGNADYKYDDNYKYIDEGVFKNLIAFIHEFAAYEDNSDALNFMHIGYKRGVGEIVTIQNYVGLIQMKSGYQIQVLPKIDFGDGDTANTETKAVFIKMLRSIKDFPSKVFNEASLRVDRMNLYEIFINMYIQEVRELVKKGLKSGYIREEDNIPYYKGKLLVNQHIKNNYAHGERFYVEFDEYNINRAENKLIKATLLKLNSITTSTDNAKRIRQLLTAFELVEPSINYEADFNKVSIDRSTEGYRNLMKWSKVFLLNKSFTTFSGKTNSRALLFPMESVFESYVAQNVRKIFTPDGWSVSCQDHGQYLFVEPSRQFALRPDIVIERDGESIVLDTKWKRLKDNSRINYGISQADMYQMYAYSKKYEADHICLLYPITDEFRGKRDIVFDSGDGTTVKVFFVDVRDIENSIKELKGKIEELS